MLVQCLATYIDNASNPIVIVLGDFEFACTTTADVVILKTTMGLIPRAFSVPKRAKIGVLVILMSEITRIEQRDGTHTTVNPIEIIRTLNELLASVPKTTVDNVFKKLVTGLTQIGAVVKFGYEDAHTTIKYENGHVVITTGKPDGTPQVSYFGNIDSLDMLAKHITMQYNTVKTSRPPTQSEVLSILEGLI